MAEQQHWILRVLRFITKEEVKTPLSFLFKVVPYLVATLIVILYSPIADELKVSLVYAAIFTLLGLCTAVLLFAWFRPKHLVYGEMGHRAEHKLEFGTESQSLSKEEFDLLPNESDPEQALLERK